ncbi:RNA polymerase sporulation sigma factor SigK [Sulfobacillus sp. hq2]|uniref:RNA polymerase subunit sigma-70 n=1 Tax=Sulfobacillus thermotolerans TaxID=338644 RepID=A0ABM6RQ57_9FIRM|nr:RNA polymerase sporulation sigma factor SigK [Sulfobacillus sp. hq2]AUW93492.1 RNA polymerase subunit sigma-70 [Sulfobacillus thermotolerans]MCY0908147.1 RNA polymerase sporulation sigma factor SigK [Sulfobacillus thermotolerans]POB10732.1 RNA polymerase subunit sigma-70 [Sulfobacillus sp. hq2]
MGLGLLALIAAAAVQGAIWLSGYIGGNAFPQPLSDLEEKEALEAMQRGDLEARQRLIEHNLRLVVHVVKKYNNKGTDPDDLIGIGAIGLIKGIDTFNQAKGTRLATYCARCIDNEVLMHLRNQKKVKNEVSIYSPIGIDRDGNEILLMDVLAGGEEVPDTVEVSMIMEWVTQFVESLTRKERLVLNLRFALNGQSRRLTQREIADRLGISRSYVSRIEKRAVEKILAALSLPDA